MTYLPFRRRPDTHMFLKPEVTKDFAVRVGHPLAAVYDAHLVPALYRALLDLANRAVEAMSDFGSRPARSHRHPELHWTVGEYREDRDKVYP